MLEILRHIRKTRRWQLGISIGGIALLLVSLGFAHSAKPHPFSATFEGSLVDADIGRIRAEVQLKGSVTEKKLGKGNFDAQGTINLATATGQGKVILHFDGGTIEMQVSGYQVESNRFAGIYRIVECPDTLGVSGGAGYLAGSFDLTEMTFQGKAWGTIQY